MNEEYCIVITTFADDENGKKIIDSLISDRLAACVQVFPAQCYYRWKGEVRCDAEKLVLIKTKRSLYSEIQESIIANHEYDTPEVIQIPIENGLPGYLDWITEECR